MHIEDFWYLLRQLKGAIFDDNSPAIHRRVGNRRIQGVPSGRLIICGGGSKTRPHSKDTWAIIAGDMFNRPYGTMVSATRYTGNKLPAYYQISLTGFG